MRTVQIFGNRDFEPHEPEVGTLPDLLQPRWCVALNRSALVRELAHAPDREAAERALRQYVERAEQAVLLVGRGFYAVKVGKGKTELSRRLHCLRPRARARCAGGDVKLLCPCRACGPDTTGCAWLSGGLFAGLRGARKTKGGCRARCVPAPAICARVAGATVLVASLQTAIPGVFTVATARGPCH